MDKLFSLLEPLVWLGIAEYVKQKNCSSFHLPLNCATCNVMWQSSVFALLNTLALIARDLMYHKILKLRPREVDITENYFADKSGLAFGSSAAALTIFLVQNHKLGYANERTIDIGKLYAFMASHAGYAMSLTTFLSTLTKLIQFRINGTFSVVEMMPITYILSISRSIYYMNQNIELDLQRIFLFSMIQISLWLLYKDLLGFDKSDTKRNFSPTKNVTSRSRLQYVFTTGEWVVISTFISIVFTDYLVRYVTFNEEISANNLSPDMIVSQAGVTGCLIGVFISRAQNIIQLCKILERVFRVGKKNCFVKSLFPIFIVVCTTILCVSVSLTKYCNDTILNDSFCPKEPMSNKKLDCLTLPFRWLIEYIFQYEYHLYCNRYRRVLRLSLLLYWTIMIVFCMMIAIIIGNKIETFSGGKRERMVIVARKYFHLVAVVLFFKPTLVAPAMMGLSYAVATSLLILVEDVRNGYEIEGTFRKYSEVVANGTSRPNKSFVTHFFELFFDEKDQKAKEGGFVITHISLLCGCAIPLWLHLLYPSCGVTPFLGIICVGVGDAAGAIVGTFYGNHKWPDSRRSIEGSAAMLVSMSIVSCLLIRSYGLDMKYNVSILVLTITTIIEAVTYQLDNICLPLLSVILSYALDCT